MSGRGDIHAHARAGGEQAKEGVPRESRGRRSERLRATARLWWRMMRMQRVTREGWFYVGFTIVVGAAAINTGNNLLHLVLGLQLSLILLSAVLSESALRGIRIRRRMPRRATAGEPLTIELSIENGKARLSSHSLIVTEVDGTAAGASVHAERIAPRGVAGRGYRLTVGKRGVARFGRVRITTRFPFGLFEKSREQDLPDELPIHPAGATTAPRGHALSAPGEGERPEPLPGQGAEFHALRPFRSGDDPREVHWRATARTGRPVVIERERERRRVVTLLVDSRGVADVDGLAESAFASARRLLGQGCEVGLAWPGGDVAPGGGSLQFSRLGDALASLGSASPSAPPPRVHRGAQGIVVEAVPMPPAPSNRIDAEPAPTERSAKGPTLAQAQRLSLLAASLAGFASLAISGELAGWAVAIFVGAAALNLALREGAARHLRNGANVLAVGALALLAVQVFIGATTVIVAAPTFAVVLAASRLLGRKGPADDALLLLAALLMLAGGAALTGELAYGLCFAAFALAGTVSLCLTHLRREIEATAATGTRISPGLIPALGGLSMAVLVGSALVFVAFPRVSAGMLRVAGREPIAGGGAERIELGGVGTIKDDPTPVMRVRFPRGSPGIEPYWRTSTFQRWTGRGWSRGETKRLPVAGGGGVWTLAAAERDAVVAEVEWLGKEPAIPLLGEPLEVRLPRKRRAVPPLLLAGADGGLEFAGALEPRFTVTASRRGGSSRDPLDGSAWLEVPADLDPRILALAHSYTSLGDAAAIAGAMADMLRRDYRYTRELPGPAEDPLAHFLFERKAGHCEYFASALSMLLRAAGIPARVAAGYFGAHWVEAGGYFVVREGDAHAWTEVWIPGKGWTRFDATPPDERAGTAVGLLAGAVDLLDLLRYWWSSWVLDFDQGAQIGLASSVMSAFASGRGSGAGLSRAARIALQAVLLVVAGALAVRAHRNWRLLRGAHLPRAHREAAGFFRAIKRELRRRGASLPPGASGAEWAAEGERVAPANAVALRAAIDAYEAARFGGRAIPKARLRALRRAALRRH